MIPKSKKLRQELNTLTEMKDVIEAFEEIAAMRMRKVRDNVLKNRGFLEGLAGVLGQVEVSYQHELKSLKKDIKDISILPNNGKMVCVLLSANTGLYGPVIKDVFGEFLAFVGNNKTDVIVVGRLGRKMYQPHEQSLKRPCVYLNYSDAGFDEDNNKKLLEEILKYQYVRVFHSLFEDILNQKPVVTDVTGDKTALHGQEASYISCLFEPSLEEVIKFFEAQILSALFEQSVYESLLGKFASRMVSLDQAVTNTNKRVKRLDFDLQKLGHKELNDSQSRILMGVAYYNL